MHTGIVLRRYQYYIFAIYHDLLRTRQKGVAWMGPRRIDYMERSWYCQDGLVPFFPSTSAIHSIYLSSSFLPLRHRLLYVREVLTRFILTINVRLILKVRDIIVFLRDKFQIMHFRGIFGRGRDHVEISRDCA